MFVFGSGLFQNADAHEVLPAIANMEIKDDRLVFDVEMAIEGILADIDLGEYADTNDAPQAATYDDFRALDADELATAFAADWADVQSKIDVSVDGEPRALNLVSVDVPSSDNDELARLTVFSFDAGDVSDAQTVSFSWDETLGMIVLRQNGVEEPYTGTLSNGETSGDIALTGGDALSWWQTFVSYIPTGFEHIVPLGMDHILFVLGLFFFSMKMRPLLWQVSAFTLAHTITLALAALGYVNVPGSIVEPLIAASIAFVAFENITAKGRLNSFRPIVIFAFGLLHGLGFASVLQEYGLPEDGFIAALIGFNIGVEVGQLFVIAIAYALVGFWFGHKSWYRSVIAIPASIAIGLMGVWWVIERTLL
ncbi:hypothetical protein BVC71_05015 [Marivivens niveibacter]|uniref:HupE / UreJ protein n=1 Tax=Marivivens niveibacter TaxID=1930667 RepID=A0A251X3A4_9RHOB|nr:hypothetical protein BVC71_05015 [Marivivens niveibacter]